MIGLSKTVPRLHAVLWVFLLLCMPLRAAAEQWVFTGLEPEVFTGVPDGAGVVAFKGVPFAAAPTGPRRWQPPAPYEPQPGRRVAGEFAPACMQGPHTVNWYQALILSLGQDPQQFSHPEAGYSEDCLYLNIWTPAHTPDERLPVMVWIHGGSNKGGWTFEPDYRGAALARQGVVVVSLAYRLGTFGFFSHPELQTEQGGVGNYGLLDLLAGLRWVQAHISAFGGDANSVTVFGESAGAANIGYLLSSPASEGLFHRAIHQSGGYQLNATPGLDEQIKTGVALGAALGTDLNGLRALSGADVLDAVDQFLPGLGFSPAVGGHALPRSPGVVFGAGDQLAVPLMIGTNRNEWLMYLEADQSVDSTLQGLGLEAYAQRVKARFEGSSDVAVMDRLMTAQRMRCPSYTMAGAVAAAGLPAWVYQLSRVRNGARWQEVGAYHGAEIPYVFDSHADWLDTDDTDRALTRVMQSYWVNFARSGDPNGKDLPPWSMWTQSRTDVVMLDDRVAMAAAPDQWLCELLAK